MNRWTGPVIDAHHHFWEPSLGRNPWLLPGAAIPFRYGDYASIKRDYLPPDLLADAQGFDVVGTVTMETEWDPHDPLGEIEHIQGVQERFGLPNAAIGHAALRDPGVAEVLEAMAEHDIVRGIRNKPGQADSPRDAAARPSLLMDPAWRRGYAHLAPLGLDFELQTAWWHLDEAIDLVREFPSTPVTINHAGLPSDRSRAGIAGWAAALSRIARCEQVWIKISGIGVPGHRWTVESNREIVERTVEAFGVERVMFASNFPVDALRGSYAEIMGGFAEIAAAWSPDEQRLAFAENAVRRYRLDPGILG
ncbi:amidohydrolase family protein [Promicromonospora panici]|uniref:amidohydrolase family protein n=1 Tax=Promicromonospora panici TaxID=2219658 RepID=UPI00101B6EAB|nr:amidohydrolase family protein [Promicromonospora panici]